MNNSYGPQTDNRKDYKYRDPADRTKKAPKVAEPSYQGPKTGGYEAFLERGLNQSGARRLEGGSRKGGFRYTSGPFKGKTMGQAEDIARGMYARVNDSVKLKYENMAAGNDVRSSREKKATAKANAAQNSGGTVTYGRDFGAKSPAKDLGKGQVISTAATQKPMASSKPATTTPNNGPSAIPDAIKRPETGVGSSKTSVPSLYKGPSAIPDAIKRPETGVGSTNYKRPSVPSLDQGQSAIPKAKQTQRERDNAIRKKHGLGTVEESEAALKKEANNYKGPTNSNPPFTDFSSRHSPVNPSRKTPSKAMPAQTRMPDEDLKRRYEDLNRKGHHQEDLERQERAKAYKRKRHEEEYKYSQTALGKIEYANARKNGTLTPEYEAYSKKPKKPISYSDLIGR